MTTPAPEPIPPVPMAPEPARGNVFGLIGLILAIVGAVLAVLGPLAFFAWVFTLPAVILGIVGLTRKGRKKGTSVAAVIVSSVGFLVAVVVSMVLLFTSDSFQEGFESGATPRPESTTTTAPVETPEVTPTPTTPPAPATPEFTEISDRDLALIVKDPAAHRGEKVVLYGVVFQLDAATGRCDFLANTGTAEAEISFEYSQRAWVSSQSSSNCPMLDEVVRGDHFRIEVEVRGALSYDTQEGGNTTVPEFRLHGIKILDPLDL